jgi:putative phosphoribosyl transferase
MMACVLLRPTDVTQDPTPVQIPIGRETVGADLVVPPDARGLVIFALGSGSGRHSPRNQQVARVLHAAGFATLLADLLTPREADADQFSGQYRFDIPRLGSRVVILIGWARAHPRLASLPIGLFGASTGAAAALLAAAARPADVAAVVSRGGRPDLAADALSAVKAPTLLLVGGFDDEVIALNRQAMDAMSCEVSIEIVAGATHLFEEPGTLEQVCRHAVRWFEEHAVRPPAGGSRPSVRRQDA